MMDFVLKKKAVCLKACKTLFGFVSDFSSKIKLPLAAQFPETKFYATKRINLPDCLPLYAYNRVSEAHANEFRYKIYLCLTKKKDGIKWNLVRFQHKTDKFNLSLSDWRLNQIFDIIKISKTLTFQGKFDIIKLKLSIPKLVMAEAWKAYSRDTSNRWYL